MLTALRIKNLALVSDLTVEFRPGYNVVTGETGAGKSILMGALNLVLGERADRNMIRSGADACAVEAVFDVGSIPEMNVHLEANGLEPCEGNQLFLKRTFSATGSNRQFINGTPAALNSLKSVGDMLVDMHGPHDHQSLLQPANQLEILDAFGGLSGARHNFGLLAQKQAALEAEKAALIVDEGTYARQLDLLRFQTTEIDAAKLKPEDDLELAEQFNRANNASKLLQLIQSATTLLAEDENALLTNGGALGRTLQELRKLDSGAEALSDLHEQAMEALRELHLKLGSYSDGIDVDPVRLVELEERVNVFHGLRRKYGQTAGEILRFGEEARTKLAELEGRDEIIERINSALEGLEGQLRRSGEQLSAARRKIIPKLAKAVTKELNDLGFKQSFFAIALEPSFHGAVPSSFQPQWV